MMVKKSDLCVDMMYGICMARGIDPVFLDAMFDIAGNYIVARMEEKAADGIDMFGNGYDPMEELEAFQNKFFKK